MYMLDHMDQTFKNAGIQKLQKQMDSKRKPHPQAEAEEMEMMDEPAPKKKEKKGAMDDEFDLMGGKPKEAPPVEVANVETQAEDQQVEEDQSVKKKKKKHHKKKKDSSLVQESMETMTFEQKI